MLTPEEQAELQAIDQELQVRQPQQSPQVGLTALEQEELDAINTELQMRENPQVMPDEEADLGFINRLKYSIEPLEANRKALLSQEFGPENVKEDEQGNLFLRQGKVFQPVNKEGFSFTDVTDVLGSAPEALGAGIGALAGVPTTGGTASVPMVIAGGMAGSAARQGISAMLGTPQVATPIERVSEIGLSGAFGGIGAGAGKVLAKAGGKALPQIKKIFPKIDIGKEGKKLLRISKELDIPSPTPGQVAGGRTLELEKALGVRRFFGRKIRKQTDEQVKALKDNLIKEVGDFIDVDSTREAVGTKIKDVTKGTIKGLKAQAGQLFDEVSQQGSKVAVSARRMKGDLLRGFQELGLFDLQGNPLKHSSRTQMTLNEFNRVQDVFGKILKDIPGSATDLAEGTIRQGQPGEFIDANTLNTMRRFIDANIKEGAIEGKDNFLLLKLRENFMDTTEQMLGAQDPALKEKFKLARSLWSKQLKLSEMFNKGGKKGLGIADLSDEKVLNKVFSDKNAVKQLKELTNPEVAEKAGVSWVNEMLTQKLGQEDKITAQAALSALKRNREALTEALGSAKYKRLRDNLFYLERIGRPINPSKSGIVQMMTLEPKQLVAGAAERTLYGARATAEGLQRDIPKYLQRLPKQGAQGLSLITDPTQRELGYKTRSPSLRNPSR